MTANVWHPDEQPNSGTVIETQWLDQFIELGSQDPIPSLSQQLPPALQQMGGKFTAVSEESWSTALSNYDNQALTAIICFFTLAEEQLPGWEAGNRSPAITVNRILKRRGASLSRDTLLWIRNNSSNRFIPNGGL